MKPNSILNHNLVRAAGFAVLLFLCGCFCRAVAGEEIRSPENQVFQFMQSGVCTNWADGSSNKASAYLWIPENCKKIRGLLILCANVPEHRLVGHPAIREVCAKNDLGIVWCVPSFMNSPPRRGYRSASRGIC